jgi:GH18 family chitinase
MRLKGSGWIFIAVIFLSGCRSSQEQVQRSDNKFVIIGYVPGFRGELDEKTIDAKKLTHINYAFVDVKDSMAWLTNIETDTINFRKLNYLKKDNPDLKILSLINTTLTAWISIGSIPVCGARTMYSAPWTARISH